MENMDRRSDEAIQRETERPGAGSNLAINARQWMTPRAHEAGDFTRDHGVKGMERETLTGQSSKWATPDAPTGGSRCRSPEAVERGEHETGTKMQVTLQDQASKWSTPKASEGGPDYAKSERSTTGLALQAMASNWPSPRAEDGESIGNHPGSEDSLHAVARNWATPSARDWKDTPGMSETGIDPDGSIRDRKDQLARQVHSFSPQAPTTQDGPPSSSATRGSRPRLNPAFAAWLMGAPWFWTRAESISSGAQVTQSWRSVQRLLLWSYSKGRE